MLAIALNTFYEIVRNRFFSIIIFLSIILIVLSFWLEVLALGEIERVLTDFWLSFLELSSLTILLFLGWWLIAREIEEKTIYLVLSKPITRNKILIGKFVWFTMILLVVIVIESLILVGTNIWHQIAMDRWFFLAIFGIFCKLLSMLSILLFTSTIASSGLTVFITITAYIIGHGWYTILEYALRNNYLYYEFFAKGILIFFPNLASLNIKNIVATTSVMHIESYGMAIWLSLLYTILVLVMASILFSKKSFDTF